MASDDVLGDPGGLQSEGPAPKRIKLEQDGIADDMEGLPDEGPPMAPPARTVEFQDVAKRCHLLWKDIVDSQHPMIFLQEYFRDPDVKKAFSLSALTRMQEAHPRMSETCMKSIRLKDAEDCAMGASGECHLLNLGLDTVKALDWPVFPKGPPPVARLFTVWQRCLTSGRGLDLTDRSLKLCVASSECDQQQGIFGKMMFAGYTNGSTLGLGSYILLWMLAKIETEGACPWQLPEVAGFLRSIARIKATFLVYKGPEDRRNDAWRAPEEEEG